jgi:hypothetical protein
MPTVCRGTKRCNNCWEVEHRLSDYLNSPSARNMTEGLLLIKSTDIDLKHLVVKIVLKLFNNNSHESLAHIRQLMDITNEAIK